MPKTFADKFNKHIQDTAETLEKVQALMKKGERNPDVLAEAKAKLEALSNSINAFEEENADALSKLTAVFGNDTHDRPIQKHLR